MCLYRADLNMSQTELDPLFACVCEATERSESFWVLKCGKAAQFLPWREWRELICQGRQCLVMDVGLVLQSSGRCVHQGNDPQKWTVSFISSQSWHWLERASSAPMVGG